LVTVHTMSAQRILVVDDEVNARRAIATILGEEGYEVAEASNAYVEEGWKGSRRTKRAPQPSRGA
jgi:CheY-like chemotaxis protein